MRGDCLDPSPGDIMTSSQGEGDLGIFNSPSIYLELMKMKNSNKALGNRQCSTGSDACNDLYDSSLDSMSSSSVVTQDMSSVSPCPVSSCAEERSSLNSSEGGRKSSLGYESLSGYELSSLSGSINGPQASAPGPPSSLPCDSPFEGPVYWPCRQGSEGAALPPPPKYPGTAALSPAAAAAMALSAAGPTRRSYEHLSPLNVNPRASTVAHAQSASHGLSTVGTPGRTIPPSGSQPELARFRVTPAEASMSMSPQPPPPPPSTGKKIFSRRKSPFSSSPAQSLDRGQSIQDGATPALPSAPTAPQMSQDMTEKLSGVIQNLAAENQHLKAEFERQQLKATTVQKVEQELQRVNEAHEDLVKTSLRREGMEKAARLRQETKLRTLSEENLALQNKVRYLTSRLSACSSPSSSAGSSPLTPPEVESLSDSKKNGYVNLIVRQNEELSRRNGSLKLSLDQSEDCLLKERENTSSLKAQLDSTLESLHRKEHECQQREQHAMRLEEIQSAFNSLVLDGDRKEAREKRYRQKLEVELKQLRAAASNTGSEKMTSSTAPSESHLFAELGRLAEMVQSQEETILKYQSESIQWRKKYLQEVSRQKEIAPNEPLPKDPLPREPLSKELSNPNVSWESARERVAELEQRLENMSAQLAERDAVIIALNRRHAAALQCSSSSSSPRGSPIHSPALSRTSLDDSPAFFIRKQSLRGQRLGRTSPQLSLSSTGPTQDTSQGATPDTAQNTAKEPSQDTVEMQTWQV